jgi:hypothetical protein
VGRDAFALMDHQVLVRGVAWDPERDANARRLALAAGGRVVWDTRRNAYENFLDACRYAQGIGAVHLEDDVTLTSEWRAKVEAVIAAHRDEVVQFYSDRKADLEVGSRRDRGRTFMAACCFYVPGRLGVPLLKYALDWPNRPLGPNPGRAGVDVMIAAFLAAEGESYWLHVPSLVQHNAWRSAINPRRPRARRSRSFVP